MVPLSMAPFDEMDPGPMGPPRVITVPTKAAAQNPGNTECNYLALVFIAGLFLLVLTD
jgi:hypothetical protein